MGPALCTRPCAAAVCVALCAFSAAPVLRPRCLMSKCLPEPLSRHTSRALPQIRDSTARRPAQWRRAWQDFSRARPLAVEPAPSWAKMAQGRRQQHAATAAVAGKLVSPVYAGQPHHPPLTTLKQEEERTQHGNGQTSATTRRGTVTARPVQPVLRQVERQTAPVSRVQQPACVTLT